MLLTLLASQPARADMDRQLRLDRRRVQRINHDLVRMRGRLRVLKVEDRALTAAIEWSGESARGLESDSMIPLEKVLAGLRFRAWRTNRVIDRLRGTRGRLRNHILFLRTALTHLFRVCPVDEPRSYVDDFGVLMKRDENGVVTKDKKKWHRHQGIDIFAPVGTPVRAPFAGWAEVATNPVGGLAVKVFGPQGFVYNAHLVAYGRIGHVEEGDLIGYVGNTGDASNTHSHDHFEWHPANGPAVDSFGYLNEACR
jgi:murein DD-endopeptidase MepM/ murein hydrolase activator NlpD